MALIIPQIAQSIPFGTLFMASAFRQVPLELVEAALLDGAERRDVLWRVLVPLVTPAASTLALFSVHMDLERVPHGACSGYG